MLDAPDPDYRDVLTAAAVEAWQPDPACLAAGDEHIRLALRHYAGALCDQQIERRVLDLLGINVAPDIRHDGAAYAVAYHCARSGLSFAEIIEVMVYLAAEVPAWLDDPDAIASFVRSAIAEAAA